MSGQRVIRGAPIKLKFQQAFDRVVVLPTPKDTGTAVPESGWADADGHYEYGVPDRNPPELHVRERGMHLRERALRCVLPLLHVSMQHHREYDTPLSVETDDALLHLLTMELLVRIDDEHRGLSLKDRLEQFGKKSSGGRKKEKDNRSAEKLREAVYGEHSAPAHNAFEQFHHSLADRDDLVLVGPLCDAYNKIVASQLSAPDVATLDEIVIHHPIATHYSKKSNAEGPEFLLLAAPISNSDHLYYHWMRGRDWSAARGPTMKTIVKQATDSVWMDEVDLLARTCVFMDSRFTSGAALRYLLEEVRGPFVGTLNTGWHKKVRGLFHRRPLNDRTRSLTLWRGYKMMFLPNEASDVAEERVEAVEANAAEADAASSSSASNAARGVSENRVFEEIEKGGDIGRVRSTRSAMIKRFKPGHEEKKILENESEFAEYADIEEEVDEHIAFNPKNQYLTIERYEGAAEKGRMNTLYLLSNFIQEFQLEVSKPKPIDAPVYRLYETGWRYVDQLNKMFKEHYCLYVRKTNRRATEHQVRFDFVFTSALHLTRVLWLVSHENRKKNYTYNQFLVQCAYEFEQASLLLKKDKSMKVFFIYIFLF